MQKDTTIVAYGQEEEDFYLHHLYRTKPFERTSHVHRTYEIYYQILGQRNYFIKDGTYPVSPGDLVFIDKYEVHKASDCGPPGQERIVLNFSESYACADGSLLSSEVLELFRAHPPVCRMKPQEQAFVQSLFDKMTKEIVKREPGFEVYLRILLIELLLFSSRLMRGQAAAEDGKPNAVHQKVSRIVQHINEHYSEPLPLSETARLFNLSPYYVSRTFKEVTGFTFVEYVNLTRIKEAQRLLRETSGKIIEIAAAVGMENIGHFDRTFKKMTKMTPFGYRKMHRQQRG